MPQGPRNASMPMPLANVNPRRTSVSSGHLHSKSTRDRFSSWSPSALKSITKSFVSPKLDVPDKGIRGFCCEKNRDENSGASWCLFCVLTSFYVAAEAPPAFVVEDFAVEHFTTVNDIVTKISERYPLPEKYTTDNWNLMSKDGAWLDKTRFILSYCRDADVCTKAVSSSP